MIPTRAGYHVTAGQNPWNNAGPDSPAHVGEIMETFGGGGHRAVGGANANKPGHALVASMRITF